MGFAVISEVGLVVPNAPVTLRTNSKLNVATMNPERFSDFRHLRVR
jgi:hypothetical protein